MGLVECPNCGKKQYSKEWGYCRNCGIRDIDLANVAAAKRTEQLLGSGDIYSNRMAKLVSRKVEIPEENKWYSVGKNLPPRKWETIESVEGVHFKGKQFESPQEVLAHEPSIPSNLWSNERIRRFEEIVREEEKERSIWRRLRKIIPRRNPYTQAFNTARDLLAQGKDRGYVYSVLLSKYRGSLTHLEIEGAFRDALKTPKSKESLYRQLKPSLVAYAARIMIMAFGLFLFSWELATFGNGDYIGKNWIFAVIGFILGVLSCTYSYVEEKVRAKLKAEKETKNIKEEATRTTPKVDNEEILHENQ